MKISRRYPSDERTILKDRPRLSNGAMCILKALAFTVLGISLSSAAPPNVIMVLVDDLGWHEFGCYGNTFNASPNVDKLASEGVRFTNAYSSSPVCSPARATLMTGQMPVRNSITEYLDDNYVEFLDPTKFVSVARTLKNKGYHTGLIGKWHLDGHLMNGSINTGAGSPAKNGFDEVLCNESSRIGSGDYFFPYFFLPGLKQRIFPTESLIDRMNLEATDFITRNKANPFFLYLSHFAVHNQLDATDSMVALFNAKRSTAGTKTSPTENPYLAAMVKQVDNGIGQILATLKANGLDNNTIVIVAGDNGGDSRVTDNGVLREGKSHLYEGGIRVPFVARWPGTFPAGTVSQTPISFIDFYPTITALTGATLPNGQIMDGVNITPLLEKTGNIAQRDLYWHYPMVVPHFLGGNSAGAVLQGDYKLIHFYDSDKMELYNISTDSSESHDLATDSLALLNSLAQKLHKKLTECLFNETFPDDFNDKDPADWTTFGGTWSAATGQYSSTAGAGVKVITDHRYFTDLVYQAEVSVAGGVGTAGIICRAGNAKTGLDAYRGYFAGINAQTDIVTFGKANNGTWTLLGSKAKTMDTAATYLLRIVAIDTLFKIFVNDTVTPVITVSDRSFDGGLLGLRSDNIPATFENVFAKGMMGGGVTALLPDIKNKIALNKPIAIVMNQGDRLQIFINPTTQAENMDAEIFDMHGKLVHNFGQVQVGNSGVVLDMASGTLSGIHLLRVSNGVRSETIKVVLK